MNLKLSPTDPRYHKIVDAVNQRVKRAEDAFRRSRYEAWRRAEEMHTSYIPETEADAIARGKRDSGEPQPLTIIMPSSYAMTMASHTYWTSVFLSRSPIHQYTGRSSVAEDSNLKLESLIDYQTYVGQHLAPLYIWLLDIGMYGIGAMAIHWGNEYRTFSQIVEQQTPKVLNGYILEGEFDTRVVRQTFRSPSYSGSRLSNIWPFDLRLDPDVPTWNFQRGEFAGRRFRITLSEIVEGEANGTFMPGSTEVFKKHISERRDGEESSVAELPAEIAATIPTPTSGLGEQMSIRLVPKDWGLGNSPYPEIWTFGVVDKKTLIQAGPQGEAHCQFPYIVTPMEVSGYHLPNRGMYEVLRPLQDMQDWMYNTHFFATRKNINGIIVADPARIVLKDLLEKDGAIVRAKSAAYGSNLRDALYQVPLTDPTVQHVADGQRIMEFMQRVFGVSDNIMGTLDPRGRKTATEVRQTNTLGISRLKTSAEWFSAVGFGPLATLLVQLTQQHMTQPMEVRIAGSMHGSGAQIINVSPEDILGQFDFVPVDGTLPIDRLALSTLWTQMFQQMGQFPEVMQAYDIGKIFGYVAQLAGLKNLDQFRRMQSQVMPDEMAGQEAQKGNIVPISQFMGERSAAQPLAGLGPLQ